MIECILPRIPWLSPLGVGLSDYDDWVKETAEWRRSVSHVPSLIREDISKGRHRPKDPLRGFTSLTEDPLAVQYSMGYKDRKYSLTYDVLKQIVQNLSIISAIINTRVHQVASFAVPYRNSKSLGFVVKHKDPGKLTTKGEREMIKDLERFIYNAGADKPNPFNNHMVRRDDFETFLKKIVRDSLMYDQACAEVIPDKAGLPYEFMAVDASTIRIATAGDGVYGPNDTWHSRPLVADERNLSARQNPFQTLKLYEKNPDDRPAFVQVINGQIQNVYTREELIFGVRNPRTDIYIQGYGWGELEQLITIITSHLYAEEYNRRFFMQGSAPKGILSLKGDAMTADQLEGFKRQWHANLEGVENSWRTPIIQTEQGVDWIALNQSNRDMEYGQWLEYLIKVSCGVFLIDPSELNFDLHGGVSQTPLFESSQEWKLKASRDRGLRPLLRFIAKLINDNIIAKIDDHFVFDFVGLDELSETEKHQLRQEQVASYMTLNEIRRAEDLPDVDGGDMVLNPSYLQALTTRMQLEQSEQQQQGLAGAPSPEGGDKGTEEAGDEEEDTTDAPTYADSFTKSIKEEILEISFDENDYDSWLDAWRDE